MVKRKSNQAPADRSPQPTGDAGQLIAVGKRLLQAGAFLLGMLLIWAFLAPMDATSVFLGSAIPQNLFWLLAAVLCAGSASLRGGFGCRGWEFCLWLGGLAWILIVTLLAGGEHNPRTGWNGFWQVVSLAACFLCGRAVFIGTRTTFSGLLLIVAGCLSVAAQGCYQIAIELPAMRARYEADPDAEIARMEDFYAPPGSPQRSRYESRLYSPEPYASFALANSLATVLSGGLVLCLALAASRFVSFRQTETRRDATQQPADRIPWLNWGCWLASSGLMFWVWLLTRSRSAYVAVLLAMLVAIGWNLTKRKRGRGRGILLAAAVVVGLSIAAGLWLLQADPQVLSEAPKSLAFRLEYWQSTLQMIADQPFSGIGLGNFQAVYPQYKLPMASEEVADPHNWWLDMAATLSLPFATLVTVWLSVLFIGLWRREETAPPDKVDQNAELDRLVSRALWLGAGLGGLMCGLLMSFLQNHQLVGGVLLGWVVAALLTWGLACWTNVAAPSTPQVSGLAALTILLSLLATGSWQATGIAVPCLTLLAISSANGTRTAGDASGGRWRRVAPLAMPLLGLGCFVLQTWRPVTTAWQEQQRAAVATSWIEQRRALDEAIEADPWDTSLLAIRAQTQVQFTVNAPPDQVAWQATRECLPLIDQWLQRDSRNFTNWRQAGRWALDLAAAGQGAGQAPAKLLERAREYFQEAVNLYPTSTELRLQLAAVAALTGQREQYLEELGAAQQLSERTPHADKKLENQLIWLPLAELPASLRVSEGREIQAEPLVKWLRSEERRLFSSDPTEAR